MSFLWVGTYLNRISSPQCRYYIYKFLAKSLRVVLYLCFFNILSFKQHLNIAKQNFRVENEFFEIWIIGLIFRSVLQKYTQTCPAVTVAKPSDERNQYFLHLIIFTSIRKNYLIFLFLKSCSWYKYFWISLCDFLLPIIRVTIANIKTEKCGLTVIYLI